MNKFCQVKDFGYLCSAESLVVTLLRRASVIARHIFVGHFLCPRCPHNTAALYTLSFALPCGKAIKLSASVLSAAFALLTETNRRYESERD
jgi:hypothetical protein